MLRIFNNLPNVKSRIERKKFIYATLRITHYTNNRHDHDMYNIIKLHANSKLQTVSQLAAFNKLTELVQHFQLITIQMASLCLQCFSHCVWHYKGHPACKTLLQQHSKVFHQI